MIKKITGEYVCENLGIEGQLYEFVVKDYGVDGQVYEGEGFWSELDTDNRCEDTQWNSGQWSIRQFGGNGVQNEILYYGQVPIDDMV